MIFILEFCYEIRGDIVRYCKIYRGCIGNIDIVIKL